MDNSLSFLIDIINIMPEGSNFYVQAPSLEDKETLDLMSPSEYEYYKVLKPKYPDKRKFIGRISKANVERFFQSVEIRFNSKLLFKGWDAIEFGEISKTVILPLWVIDKYKNKEMYILFQTIGKTYR